MMYEKKGRYIVEFPDIPKARQHQIEIEVEERKGNYNEVELGFDEERAQQEAKRCLSCRRCLGCALCWAECKPEAIIFEMEDEVFELEADEVIISSGVERPLDKLRPELGFGKELNVILDVQLERMLSKTGPSAGLVIRPFDGEIPGRIAFVQSYDSASPNMHRAALCFALNGAIEARRRLPGTEIHFYVKDLEAFQKENEAELAALDNIRIEEARVEQINAAENHSLELLLEENGSTQKKTFDLVVLITRPQLSKDAKDLSKRLGLNLDYASFLAEDKIPFMSTDKESVRLAAQP